MQAVRAGRSDTCTGLTQKCVSHSYTRPALTPRPWATFCAVGTEQNIMSPRVSPATDQGVPVSALLYAGHVLNTPLMLIDPSGFLYQWPSGLPKPDEDDDVLAEIEEGIQKFEVVKEIGNLFGVEFNSDDDWLLSDLQA